MALVDRDHAVEGTEVDVHIVGMQRKARIVADSPHDPSGQRMRA
jgi:dimethylglycine dehydrogenase